MSTPPLAMDGVTKVFERGTTDVVAVNEVSLLIERDEFVIVMGPSGSGKTTLLALAGTLLKPTRGEIRIGGQSTPASAADRARLRRDHIGMVFQDAKLIPYQSALANVEYALLYRGLERDRRRQAASEALATLGLKDRMDHLPHELSAGEQQRVALARAIVTAPRLLLADEPTANLDSATGKQTVRAMSKAVRSGRSILLVTHDQQLLPYATRVLRMRDGTLFSA